MANEISLSVTMSAAKGGASESVSASTSITMTDADMFSTTMVAPVSTGIGSVIPVGSCLNGGLMFIKNLSTDTTVIVDVAIQRAVSGSTTALTNGTFATSKILSIGAGEVAVFRTIVDTVISGVSYPLYLVKSSGAVLPFIQVTVLES